MRIITLHCDYIRFKPVKAAIKKPQKLSAKEKKGLVIKECLVVLTAVEVGDESKEQAIAKNLVANVQDIAAQVKAKTIVLYPYVHLTSEPASPDSAQRVLKGAEKLLGKKFKVTRAPFGWYKEFELKCKGHPLSELSRIISAEAAEAAEEAVKKNIIESFLVILPDGMMLSEDDIREALLKDSVKQKIITIIEEETGKPFEGNKEKKPEEKKELPIHLELARKLHLAEHEPVSDAGCFRFLPAGAFIKEAIRRLAWQEFVDGLNCLPIATPAIVGKTDPGVLWLIRHFPERQYKVLPGKAEKKQEFFLRTAGDYGSFSVHRDAIVSYKNLPLALYENERDYRYEQRGEIRGLHRIREFEMHNVHAACQDFDQALDFFKKVFYGIVKIFEVAQIKPDAFIFCCSSELFKKYKKELEAYLKELAKRHEVPIVLELLREVAVYMGAWIDFLVFDCFNRPMELGTAQLDFVSAKNWNIKFIDKDGKEKHPIIVHSGFGSERAIAALLEIVARGDLRHATLPFWLCPVQVRVIPVSERYIEEAKEMVHDLNYVEPFIRADLDERPLHVEKKILEAEQEWIPFVVCLGKKELEKDIVTVRFRASGQVKELKPVDFKNLLKAEQGDKPFVSIPYPTILSQRPKF